jgi:hypothetical protein
LLQVLFFSKPKRSAKIVLPLFFFSPLAGCFVPVCDWAKLSGLILDFTRYGFVSSAARGGLDTFGIRFVS